MKGIQTLRTRLITDSNITITAELLEIKGNWATIFFDKKIVRRKIKTSFDGTKYIFPNGYYSMCPSFEI
tara:strand:- start:1343 stop:1549 length:207 start_codon:yes stop_codon:yes gene_type:complete